MNRDKHLQRYAWLSIAAALLTITLKTLAWWLTGSVGLLSDAMESLVNLAGAVMALWMLHLAAQPADSNHTYGHSKAEYFASAFEGFLILVAALSIGWTALDRLLHPKPLEQLGIGLAVSVLASIVNFVVARILLVAGRQYRSITLEADGQHLMTDVWTSAGVLAGIGAVALSGWNWLDPVVALLVAVNIVWTGVQLMRRSADGLMDIALQPEQQEVVDQVLESFRQQGIGFHALLSRQAGARVFLSMHVLVPGLWTVQQGHDKAEEIEAAIRAVLPHAHVLTHLEPIEDRVAHDDEELDRQ